MSQQLAGDAITRPWGKCPAGPSSASFNPFHTLLSSLPCLAAFVSTALLISSVWGNVPVSRVLAVRGKEIWAWISNAHIKSQVRWRAIIQLPEVQGQDDPRGRLACHTQVPLFSEHRGVYPGGWCLPTGSQATRSSGGGLSAKDKWDRKVILY